MTLDAVSTAREVKRNRGRWIGWILIIALVIGGALLVVRITDATSVPFRGGGDPEGTGEHGTMALAEILRGQGIEVDVVRSRAEAARMIGEETTLALTDPYPLSDEAVTELLAPADRVVLLTASSRMLGLLELGEDSAASTAAPLAASCDLPEFDDAGTIRPGRLFTPEDHVTGCYQDEAGNAALLVDERSDSRVSMIDGSRLFGNGYLAEDGNAAVALALLGQTDHVVWYLPSFADSDLEAQTDPTLGELTPGWVTPAIIMLILAAIAAGLWRGRRFGPLVVETLPVTVRASETMQGRARLTARAGDSAHAALAIRSGTVRRIARRLGLPDRATGAEVADAAADRLRVPRSALQELLTGPPPTNDHDLVDSSRRLAELETAIDDAVRAERGTR